MILVERRQFLRAQVIEMTAARLQFGRGHVARDGMPNCEKYSNCEVTSLMKLASMARGHANLSNQIRPSKQQMATSKIGSGAQFALQQF